MQRHFEEVMLNETRMWCHWKKNQLDRSGGYCKRGKRWKAKGICDSKRE
jgi:hypothetical protein